VAPTPALAVAAPPTIVAFWAPSGAVYGSIELTGDVAISAQYAGWAQFQTAHMAAPLWAPVAALTGAVPAERLAAAPELLPTAAPAQPTAQPQIVYAAAPAAVADEPQPTAAELQPQPTAEMRVLVDTAERYIAVAVSPPGATTEPEEWGAIGGGGGSWGP
jgi:hypothetical protein